MNNISVIDQNCVGCRSCEQICPQKCIYIEENWEGFLYPRIETKKCIGCGICLEHCPVKKDFKNGSIPKRTCVIKNRDEKRIMDSASGGVSNLLAQYILSIGGIVIGCAFDEHLVVKHVLIERYKNLYKIQ